MKRFLVCLLVIISILNAISVSSAYEEATDSGEFYFNNGVIMLSKLNIIKISETYSEAFDEYMSRGEAVNAVIRCIYREMGNIDSSSMIFTVDEAPFEDVGTKEYWTYNISLAKMYGIIADGKEFRPNDNITCDEFIKMVVCASGYAMTSEEIEYPEGYRRIASKIRLLKNTYNYGQYLKKSDFVIILDNFLNSTPIVFDYSGGGFNGTKKGTLLEEVFNVKKSSGRVVKTSKTAIDSYTWCEKGMFEYRISNDNTVISIKNGDFVIDDYLGRITDIYYADSDNGYMLINIIPKRDDVTIITADMFDKFSRSTKKLEYYKTTEINIWDKKVSHNSIVIPKDCDILINGVYSDDASYAYDILEEKKLNVGTIKLIDYDIDGTVDIIDIQAYYTMFVRYINSQKLLITDRYSGNTVDLADESREIEYSIYMSGSEAATNIESIKKGNVLEVFQAVNGSRDFYKIIICSEAVKTKISVIADDGITVEDGKTYKISNTAKPYANDIKAGSEYNLIIDECGRIGSFTLNEIAGSEYDEYGLRVGDSVAGIYYGVALKMRYKGKEDVVYANIYTLDGQTEKLACAQKCKIDDVKVSEDNLDTISPTIIGKLVKYELNDAGEIKRIDTPKSTRGNNQLSYVYGFSGSKVLTFKTGSNIFYSSSASASISKNTKIINCPNTGYDESEYSIGNVNQFSNDLTYTVEPFYTGADGVTTNILLCYSVDTKIIPKTADFFVVDKVRLTLKDNDVVIELSGLENNKAKKYYCYGTEVVDKDGNKVELSRGDIIQVAANSLDEFEIVKLLYDCSNPANYTPPTSYADTGRIIIGGVYETDSTTMRIVKNTFVVNKSDVYTSGATELHDVSSAKIYIVDNVNKTLTRGERTDLISYVNAPTCYSKVCVANHYGNNGATIVIYKED